MSYDVALTVGSDINARWFDLNKTIDNIFVDPHETKIVSINIDFNEPRLNRGAFREWLNNKNDLSVWDKTWFRAVIETFSQELGPIEDYSGAPKLIKPLSPSFVINSSVSPANGSFYTPFTYAANINTSEVDIDIGLETMSPGSTIWRSQGVQTCYAGQRSIIWSDLTFGSTPAVLGMGKYRFTFDGSKSNVFFGPMIEVAVRNETFIKRGDFNFDYTADVRSSLPTVDMELMFTDDGIVWEHSGLIRTYKLGKNSSAIPPWITLVWQNQPWHKTIRIDERGVR